MNKTKPTPADIAKSMDQYRLLWKPDHVPGMTLTEYKAQKEALLQALKRFDYIRPSCGHCEHFYLDHCKHHGADVPKDFQKKEGACEHWTSNGVPF